MIRKVSYYITSIFRIFIGLTRPLFITAFFLGIVHPKREKIQLRNSKLQFWVRSPMDVWSIKETFLDRFYLRSGISIQNHWTIIDIGAGIGDFTIQAACDYPDNRVFAFEPYPDSFSLLEENLLLNGIRNVNAFPVAVGAHDGDMVLDLSSGEPLQLQSAPVGNTPSAETIEVPSQTLSDLFEAHEIDRCHLLKLDCEGAEFSILMHNSDSWLPRVERITLEYHNDLTEHTHHQLVEFLSDIGFKITTRPNSVHASLGYLYAWR